MPPSLHACGKRYEWKRGPEDVELAQAPRWLLARLTQLRTPQPVGPTNGERRIAGRRTPHRARQPARRHAPLGRVRARPGRRRRRLRRAPMPAGPGDDRSTCGTYTPPPGTSLTATSRTHDRMADDDRRPAQASKTHAAVAARTTAPRSASCATGSRSRSGSRPGSTSRTSSATAADAPTAACSSSPRPAAAASLRVRRAAPAVGAGEPARHDVRADRRARARPGAHQGRTRRRLAGARDPRDGHRPADQGRREPRLARAGSCAPRPTMTGYTLETATASSTRCRDGADRPEFDRNAAQHIDALTRPRAAGADDRLADRPPIRAGVRPDRRTSGT